MELEVETIGGETEVVECDAALFDADETLFTGFERGPVEEARSLALSSLGFVVPPFERLRGLAGEHARIVIGKFQSPEGRRRLETGWEEVVTRFQAALSMPTQLTPLSDASGLLERAQAMALPTAIATNSTLPSWEAKASRMPIEVLSALSTVVTMTCVGGKPKPHPAMLLEGARRLGAKSPVLFGDAKVDARAAANAQIPAIIRRAGRTEEELQWILAHGARIVDDFSRVRIVG